MTAPVALGRSEEPLRIARDAILLRDARVGWATVHRLAVVVRLAGVRPVLDLGSAVVDGPKEGMDACRTVLQGLVEHRAPHDALLRIARVLRSVSVRVAAS